MVDYIPYLIDEEIIIPSNAIESLEKLKLPKDGDKITKLLVVHPPINEEEQELMQKIVKAAGFNLTNAVAIELVPKDKLKFGVLQQKLGFQKLISFGILPEQLGLNINCPFYHPIVLGEVELLISEKLLNLKEKDKKNLLWQSLKLMFNL